MHAENIVNERGDRENHGPLRIAVMTVFYFFLTDLQSHKEQYLKPSFIQSLPASWVQFQVM